MSALQEITYKLDFNRRQRNNTQTVEGADSEVELQPIPRVARLMALAIRLDGSVRAGTIRDYADLARRGHVTRARITQIMKLLDLAPDIQEQVLFLPACCGLNERNLRPIVRVLDWDQQRIMFQKIVNRAREQ